MYVESILQQIKHRVEDIEFITKDDEHGRIGLEVACTDGIVFGLKFTDESERGLLWDELSETPPVPFVQIGSSFIRVKHLRMVKIAEHEKRPAIILAFTSPATIIKPYMDDEILKRDYGVLAQILSHYQDQCANISFPKTQQ